MSLEPSISEPTGSRERSLEEKADPIQQALTKLADNNLRLILDGRSHAARVVQSGEKISGIPLRDDCICCFDTDGKLVKTIPILDYLQEW